MKKENQTNKTVTNVNECIFDLQKSEKDELLGQIRKVCLYSI